MPLRMELSSIALSLPQGGGNERAAFVPPFLKGRQRSFVLGQSMVFQRWKRPIKEPLLVLGSQQLPSPAGAPLPECNCVISSISF